MRLACCKLFALLLLLMAQVASGAPDYLSDRTTQSVKLSPDGKRVATVVSQGDLEEIILADTATGRHSNPIRLNTLSDDESSISTIAWIDSDTLAVAYREVREGVLNMVNTKAKSEILVLPLKPGLAGYEDILSVRTAGSIIDPLPNTAGKFLYAKNGYRSSIYTVAVDKLHPQLHKLGKLEKRDGGQFVRSNAVATIDKFVIRWLLNLDGSAAAVLHWQDNGAFALSTVTDDGSTELLKEWPKEEDTKDKKESEGESEMLLIPISLATKPKQFYAFDYSETVRRTVYLVDYETETHEVVYQSSGNAIYDTISHPETNEMIGVIEIERGKAQSVFFERSDGDRFSLLQTNSDWHFDRFIESSADDSVYLRYEETHDRPGRYVVEHEATGKSVLVAELLPDLAQPTGSRQVAGSVLSGELKIEYLLNLPPASTKGPYPLVVTPHGGPIEVNDTGYFDLQTQYLAAQGFAVLRVNFRGSSGYGDEFVEAGVKQWGTGMLLDIHAAATEVAQNPDVDGGRVCLFGASYGGYAATKLLLEHPDFYACAVSISGVSDINLLVQRAGISDDAVEHYLKYVGDPLEDHARLKAESTVYDIHTLQRPLLLMHGEEDLVVDPEHSWRLKRLLDKHQLAYEWLTIEEMGHSFEDAEQQRTAFGKATTFLQQHFSVQ